ncbi:sugar ABC transporter permease [Paenibacillus sp. J5C_2022]|nr:sugar ABC transporter permease [Paenibacillus sp. J5C2022]MCU6708848.1 sugar ABC transporter permease [Paenibacillus sp. J5C2022]
MWKYRLSYLFVMPFLLLFFIFILIPVLFGILLSFTDFNAMEFPRWVGWDNYQNLLSQDTVFLQHVLPNTFTFALFVGPLGYVCAFLLAAAIAQMPRLPRTGFALAMYAPSLTTGIAMVVVWQVMFTGDRTGYINSFLLKWGFIQQPIFFVLDPNWLLPVMIVVSIWASMGIGFLAILAGILNVDRQLIEAGRIDGIANKLQELWYITIPSMKPQLLFAAVMSIVHTLKTGGIGTQLSGTNPTPNYAGQLMINHIEDYAFIRFEMGYASAISVVLLLLMYMLSRLFTSLFGSKEG